MANPVDFALNDSLDDLMSSPIHTDYKARISPKVSEEIQKLAYVEKCLACRGTGKFISYSGRIVGPCFKCQGKGQKTFKTSAESRQNTRVKAAQKRADTAESNVAEFNTANPDIAAWIVANPSFEFAVNMAQAIAKYGDLTEGQRAAVEKCMARSAQWKADRAARDASAQSVDITALESAFAAARRNAANDGEGIERLRLRLDTFTFSDAPANGQWPAAIFVKEGDNKLGRITGARFLKTHTCDAQTESRVLEAAKSPFEAAKAYGQRTKSCSCCGRTLTNKVSRENGIGPICAEKYGWGV